MSGFLDRLAGMALGTPAPGAARVALSPRFLPPPAAALSEPTHALLDEDPAAAPKSQPAATAQASPPRSARATAPPEGETTAWAADVARPQAGVETPAPFPRSAPAAALKTNSVEPARTATPSAPLVVRATLRDMGTALRPAATPAPAEPASARARMHPVAPIAPLADRIAPAAPLSRVTVASRISQSRDERPVVHVTIDRIDVRAPAAARSEPTQRRARPQPSVSLTDYLRGERRGRP